MLLRYLLVNQSILQPLGMLQFMNFWFAGFLFGGFLIGEDSLIWPFRLFFYIMPFGPYLRSTMYLTTSLKATGAMSVQTKSLTLFMLSIL
jgi:hypothetical protein